MGETGWLLFPSDLVVTPVWIKRLVFPSCVKKKKKTFGGRRGRQYESRRLFPCSLMAEVMSRSTWEGCNPEKKHVVQNGDGPQWWMSCHPCTAANDTCSILGLLHLLVRRDEVSLHRRAAYVRVSEWMQGTKNNKGDLRGPGGMF